MKVKTASDYIEEQSFLLTDPTIKNCINKIHDTKKDSKHKGNYILGTTLGEGTFGKVKLATNIQTNEKVAIKILDKSPPCWLYRH